MQQFAIQIDKDEILETNDILGGLKSESAIQHEQTQQKLVHQGQGGSGCKEPWRFLAPV